MPKRLTNDEFIKRAKEKHGENKFNYSLTIYKNNETKVLIICSNNHKFLQKPSGHLNGQGCPECVGKLNKDNNKYIEKANKIHKNKYNYSKTTYISNNYKIEIICFDHGSFFQSPTAHLHGQGCPECSGKIKRTTEKFISLAKKTHGNLYNYYETEYVNRSIKVSIICGIHGLFEQQPQHHINGSKCPKCEGFYKTTEEYILEAKEMHGDLYIYDKINYVNTNTKIDITCKDHGVFQQLPKEHADGQGCPKCAGKIKTTEDFIIKCKSIHGNKYDYSKTEYKNSSGIIKIICLKHGLFEQTAISHTQGHGCPDCVNFISKPELQFLDYLGIPNDKKHRQVSLKINGKLFKIDGLIPETKVCFEFNGDYFHGNPQKYKAEDYNAINNKTFGELYQKTLEKEQSLKDAGYLVISVWEKDWKKFVKDNDMK